MTEQTRFHRHWHVKIQKGSRTEKVVRAIAHIPLRKVDFEAANKSRFVYGAHDMSSAVWTLTVLGVLHTLTGLTLEIVEPVERCEECGLRHPVDQRHGWTDGT